MTDSPADMLRKARIERGFKKAVDAAQHFGWNVSTYRSNENGSRPITKTQAVKYAQEYGLNVGALLNLNGVDKTEGNTEHIFVGGEAAMGVWREVGLRNDKVQRLAVPKGKKKTPARKGVPVTDESVNLAIGMGETAIYVEWDVDADQLVPGMLVYVERTRGDLFERSIRRVELIGDHKFRLTPFSNVPKYVEAVSYPPKSGETILLIGKVIGKYVEFD